MLERLRSEIQAARDQHTRLVLVVGPHGAGKTDLLRSLAESLSTSIKRLSGALSSEMLVIPFRQRPIAVVDKAIDLIRTTAASGSAVIDNIELLFLPELRLDPLKLLEDSARNGTVIAAWPGSIENGALSFAATGHPEFRSYPTHGARIVEV